MTGPGAELRAAIEQAAPLLRVMNDERASIPRAPGKWSPKEIIGHLIDSASNNHGRFVRAQLSNDLRFQGYAQDDWVRAQNYAGANWLELIDLWEKINLHLARIMDLVPAVVRMRPRTDHNMHQVAFRSWPPDQPATLDWFMHDYVEHLKHHLRQIDMGLVQP